MNAILAFAPLAGQMNAFARSAEGTADLFLLRDIEQTVESLTNQRNMLEPLAALSRDMLTQLRDLPVLTGYYVDPEDEVVNSLARSASALESHLSRALHKRSFIDRDNRLNANHCDLLHLAYEGAITAIADAIESIKDLRAVVISRDLAAESRDIEAFESCDALIASLRNGAE